MIYNSSIEYPHISPLRWVEPLSDARYLRKMASSDTWRVQLLSDNDIAETFYLKVYSSFGFYLTSFTFTKSTLSTGKYYWDAYPDATTIIAAITALNIHYIGGCVVFKVYNGSELWADSGMVEIGSFSDTMQVSVWNSSNDLGTVFGDFSWYTLFSFRVEATWERGYLKPAGEYETFLNQMNEPTVVNSNPYSKLILTIGDKMGLSDDMIEQIMWFFSCDAILVDYTQYVRGELTEVINESRGTRQMTVEMIPATRRQTQNILGEDIFITDENANIIEAVFPSPETDKLLVL